jgi:methyltransferase (TIGR00027 family)
VSEDSRQLEASNTALGVASHRAAHLVLDQPPPILNDSVAMRLLGPGAEERIRAAADRLRSPYALAFRSTLLLRSRFAEDALAESAAEGVRQFVSLGAGMDTFAYRQPDWAGALRIFEADHPASQSAKLERLAAAAIETPRNVSYAPLDLERESPADGLARAGFDPGEPATVSCLGVLMYLRPETVDSIFGFVARLAPGSRFVFTFAQPAVPLRDQLAESAARGGEPWLTRFEPEALLAALSRHGLPNVELLDPARAQERYFHNRTDGLHAPRRISLGMVRIDQAGGSVGAR